MAPCRILLVAVVMTAWSEWSTPSVASAQGLAPVKKDQLLVDSLLDNVMMNVQRELFKAGFNVADLPDVTRKDGRLTLTGTEGLLKGLSSIYRSEGAFVEYGGGNVSISSTFSLATLEISYRINAKYLFLSTTRDVGATVRMNRIKLAAGIFTNGDACYMGMDGASVEVLEGVDWRVSGFGAILDPLVSAAINLLVKPSSIKTALNASLQQALAAYQAPCHNFLPGVNKGLNWNC